ncbi:MAG TPA: SDR family NAD(P)-dependent oxidoreductase [Ktedonosporobacter sp.]|jgi:NAD(P)-dependent dehydrogenase (short-subunit alcohol dehydrogenase family)|nr:SDR family NAD(P)-dependent oxidoreductase [Ktedonosporobacter sp.]
MKRKTIIITGSTKGIGKGIALRLARDYHNIVLNYATDEKQAQETLHLCEPITPQVMLVKADVSARTEVEHLMQECVHRFGSLDVLINNAACVIDKPMLEMSEQEWEQVVNVNMKDSQTYGIIQVKKDE